MNIPFRRIGKTPQEFEVTSGEVTLKGTLFQKEGGLVLMKAHIGGKLTLPCDICAEDFDTMLDDEVELLLSDGLYHGSHDDLDVVEMDGSIDLDELLHSEIELIRSDYHSCEACKNKERK
jgi:uncharacterized metal-binding protein YceD (DUF177 family)